MIFSFCLGLWFHSRAQGSGFRASSSRLVSQNTRWSEKWEPKSAEYEQTKRGPTVPPLAPYHHHGVGPGEHNDPSAGRDDGCDLQTFVASGGIDVSISFSAAVRAPRGVVACVCVRLHSYHVCIAS